MWSVNQTYNERIETDRCDVWVLLRRNERRLCQNGKWRECETIKKKSSMHAIREAVKTITMLHCENEYIQTPHNQCPQQSLFNSWPAQPGIFLISSDCRPFTTHLKMTKPYTYTYTYVKWKEILTLTYWIWVRQLREMMLLLFQRSCDVLWSSPVKWKSNNKN